MELAGILDAAVVGGGAVSRVKKYRWFTLRHVVNKTKENLLT